MGMNEEIHLRKKDFRVDWFSGTGGGGQHRNKHQNCCRITHKDTGLSALGTSHRERSPNQKDAFERLTSLLVSHFCAPEHTQRRIDAERVRTYHEPRNEVIDHASGTRMTYKEVVGKPNLGPLIEARNNAIT